MSGQPLPCATATLRGFTVVVGAVLTALIVRLPTQGAAAETVGAGQHLK